MVMTVTTSPYRVNSQKEMGRPLRSASPRMTTLADAPTAVALPPRSAPNASDHHNTRVDSPPPLALTNSATTGLMVATYGMLSTTADSTADPHSRTMDPSSSRPCTASAAARDTCSMTPVLTSAPTMTN